MTYRTGSVGDFFAWTMTVAKEPRRATEQPKQWFDSDQTAQTKVTPAASPEAMVKLLSSDNLALLKLIAAEGFESMRELAELAHRKESNLSVTLKKLADAGIVTLETRGKRVQPRLVARRVTLDLDLVGADSVVSVIRQG